MCERESILSTKKAEPPFFLEHCRRCIQTQIFVIADYCYYCQNSKLFLQGFGSPGLSTDAALGPVPPVPPLLQLQHTVRTALSWTFGAGFHLAGQLLTEALRSVILGVALETPDVTEGHCQASQRLSLLRLPKQTQGTSLQCSLLLGPVPCPVGRRPVLSSNLLF